MQNWEKKILDAYKEMLRCKNYSKTLSFFLQQNPVAFIMFFVFFLP